MNKPMSFIAFLKDRWLLLIGWVIFLADDSSDVADT